MTIARDDRIRDAARRYVESCCRVQAMTEVVATLPRTIDIARVADVDTATLRAELSRALKLTADYLLYLAAIWVELERRGEDLSDLRVGFAAYLPAIAAGAVSASAVVAFAGEPRKLKAVSRLPVDEQEKCAKGLMRPPVLTGHREGSNRSRSFGSVKDEATPAKSVLEAMASQGGSQDVAEMLMDVVRAAGNPRDVAARLQALIASFLAIPVRR